MRVLAAATALFLLAGCTSNYYQALKSAEAAGEPQVDAALKELLSRACKVPIDVMERNLDTDDKAFAAYVYCKELRSLYDRIDKALKRSHVPMS